MRLRPAASMWLALAPACGSSCEDDPLPEEGELCLETPECEPTDPPERAEIGTLRQGLSAWQDGDVVELVSGGQGGVMILPSFCLPAAHASGDEACVGMTLRNRFDGGGEGEGEGEDVGEGEGPFIRRFLFTRAGDRLCGGPLYDLLGYSRGDVGTGVTVTVDLCGAGVHATGDVHVTY